MARDLESLEETLWRSFEEARERLSDASNWTSSGYNEKIEATKAFAAVAQALVGAIGEKRAQAEAAEKKPGVISKPAA